MIVWLALFEMCGAVFNTAAELELFLQATASMAGSHGVTDTNGVSNMSLHTTVCSCNSTTVSMWLVQAIESAK